MISYSRKPYPSNGTRKRTHLKPSQVAVLQESFVTNTLPDASMRSYLANELGVSERTIQIWFQNRRAKVRKLEVSSPGQSSLIPNVRTGWIGLPPQQQQRKQSIFSKLMTPELFEQGPFKRRPRSSSKPEKGTFDFIQPFASRAMSEGVHRDTKKDAPILQPKALITFPVNSIRIGSWARFATQITENECDLICFSDPLLRQLIWQVQDDGHQFRIEVDYENIKEIRLGGREQTDVGQLDIEINNQGVSFSMKRVGIDQDWVRCNDFTENMQASMNDGSHILQGSHDHLRQSLLEIISQAPDLAARLILIPEKPDYMCRDISISPSATPEPIQYFNPAWNMSVKTPTYWNNLLPYDSSWTYLNMLNEQQRQQQIITLNQGMNYKYE
ncbi:hypothetical protein BDB01DRAFT_793462 [Pilobolus umbonatus]|nr:hypothetical protein BDB01DRAFT_793462 [Pilobolus umbonatus]